ncbi:MAG: hypothetical protein MJ080_04490 [Clostridia bacterium]|nr:hypothetical protein [Clostridia bacterium]
MFSTEESQDTALNSIFQKATQEQRTGIRNFFRKFILWIKGKLGKTSYTEQLGLLEDKWINLIKNSEATEETGAVKYSVGQTSDGINYVLLDKIDFISNEGKIISGRDFYKSLINTKIKFEDGDVVTFVKKLPDVKMYDELFRRYPTYKDVTGIKVINDKVNKNIKEVFEISKLEKRNVPQHHEQIGIENFDNRSVYITDEINAYKLTLSIANLTDGSKIGYAKEYLEPAPKEITEKIIEAETRRKSSSESASIKDDKSSNNSISNNPENVKKKNSISPENIRYNQERYVNWLLNTQYKLNVKEDAVNKFAKELKDISALDNGTAKQKAEARELLDELSKKMADEYNVPLIPEAQELLRYIRNTKFSLTETQKQEARDKYGSVTNIILISINQVE